MHMLGKYMNKFFVLRALVLFLLYFVRCTGFEPIETSSITSTSIPSLLPQFRSHDEEAVPVVPVGTEILYWHLHVAMALFEDVHCSFWDRMNHFNRSFGLNYKSFSKTLH